jgi:hypothetical protein
MTDDLRLLREDFLRFSKLHSWYKHIPFNGLPFYFYKKIGQQIRHHIDPQVDDELGEHWHFSNIPPNDISYKEVWFGPFLRGDGCGVDIIKNDYGKDLFLEWVKTNYTEQYKIMFDYNLDYNSITYKELYKAENIIALSEQNKYWNRLIDSYNSNS